MFVCDLTLPDAVRDGGHRSVLPLFPEDMREVECARLRGHKILYFISICFGILTFCPTPKVPKNILYNLKIPIYLREEEVREPLVPAVVLGTLLPLRVKPLVVVFIALTRLVQVIVADGAKMPVHLVCLDWQIMHALHAVSSS